MTGVIKRRAFTLALLAAMAFAPAAYAGSEPLAAQAQAAGQATAGDQRRIAADPFVRTELFFGTEKPDGSEVTKKEWRQFLADEVTPRFPDGLTVLDGIGQFRDSSGTIIREKSFVLVLLYPAETLEESSEKIDLIREAYKTAFEQQSVLRVDDPSPVLVSF
jgi:hypothetical protein